MLPPSPRLALLETPAGFELNSRQVIGRVGDFFTHRLQNFNPQIEIIPARKRGTAFSPDDPEIVAALLQADMIFLGPGSPSYAIRQLHNSLAWFYIIARHRLNAVLALASAASVAFSAFALPVYEIYKVGDELHWLEGLDFFKFYGLHLVCIPHWNNQEGGAELDTSRCFMGKSRFIHLMEMLPEGLTIVGLDEKTALIMDPSKGECQVKGLGKVTLIHTDHKHFGMEKGHARVAKAEFADGMDADLVQISEARSGHVHCYKHEQVFPMSELGQFHAYHHEDSLPQEIWQKAILAAGCGSDGISEKPTDEVMQLILKRDQARLASDWASADMLRKQIVRLGWELQDTKAGTLTKKLPEQ